MNEKYLIGINNRYKTDTKFKDIVNGIANTLIYSDFTKSDIVRISDMAAIVALDARERGFSKEDE